MADFTTYTHPEIGSVQQEANTAILPDVSDKYLRAAQVKYAMDEAERQRKQKQIADDMAMFNFDTKGVWSRDVNAINDQINAGIKKFKNIEWLKRYNSGDMTAMQEYSDFLNGVNASIDKSKQSEAYFYKLQDEMGKDSKYQNQATLQGMNDFYKTPLSDNYPQLQIAQWNPYETVANINANLKKDSSVEYQTVGNQTKSVALKDVVDPIDSYKLSLTDYNASPDRRNGVINTFLLQTQDPNTANEMHPYWDGKNYKEVVENGQKYIVNEPKYKKLSEFTPQEYYQAVNYEPFSKIPVQENLSGAQSSLSNGSGSTKTKLEWSISPLTTNTTVESSGIRKPNSFNVESINFATTNEQPKGINIDAPRYYYDVNQQGFKNPTNAGSWTVDVIKLSKVPYTENKNRTIKWNSGDKHLMVQVVDDKGKTLLIPYEGDIKRQLEMKFPDLQGLLSNQQSGSGQTQSKGSSGVTWK